MPLKYCSANFHPLDKAVGIIIGAKQSPAAAKAILDIVTNLSYSKSSRYLAKLACTETRPQKITVLVST